jgi:hypothetical protein
MEKRKITTPATIFPRTVISKPLDIQEQRKQKYTDRDRKKFLIKILSPYCFFPSFIIIVTKIFFSINLIKKIFFKGDKAGRFGEGIAFSKRLIGKSIFPALAF